MEDIRRSLTLNSSQRFLIWYITRGRIDLVVDPIFLTPKRRSVGLEVVEPSLDREPLGPGTVEPRES